MKTSNRLSLPSVALALAMLFNAAHAADVRTAAQARLLAANADAAFQIRVAVQEDSAPKYLADAPSLGGAVSGICPDLLRAIEKKLPGVHFVFEPRAQPLRRIENRMEIGELDANCLADNATRRSKFQVAPMPLFAFDYHLIARADDPVQITGWDDVRRLGANGKILILSGTGMTERLREVGGLTFEESGKSATTNLRKLIMGRGRFFYYRTLDWNSQLRAAMVTGQVRILPMRMETVQFHLMFGPHLKSELLPQVERALQELDADGTLARIRKQWRLRPSGTDD